jgi:purine-binding chemotaxis protein CheW
MTAAACLPRTDQTAIEATLKQRARRLALPQPAPDYGRAMEVLVCRLGAEEFALELRLLQGVFRAHSLTPVPCTPAVVAGLINLRGEVVTVLDLAAALGLVAADRREVLLAETSRVRVGLLVDEALEVRWIAMDGLQRGFAGTDFVRGIDNARTVLLDLEALLTDERFEVAGA